jgi:hypothetical protein
MLSDLKSNDTENIPSKDELTVFDGDDAVQNVPGFKRSPRCRWIMAMLQRIYAAGHMHVYGESRREW